MADGVSASGTNPQLGSYRLVRRIGSGGMSTVVQAEHIGSHTQVALKILPRSLARRQVTLQRFLKEAKHLEALDHPNIVTILDSGSDSGRYYLVFELVSGGSLQSYVAEHGPLSPTEVIRILRQTALALSYAVGQGVIHRDIKPPNLLVSEEGHIKVADLGLARQSEDEEDRLTREGTTVGTVDYIAPEQARDSHNTSERSDIYALGCTLYFLLAGHPPFLAEALSEKLRCHVFTPPPDIRDLRRDVPAAMAMLILRMMAKDPADRPQNYEELIELCDWLDPGFSPDLPPLGAALSAAQTAAVASAAAFRSELTGMSLQQALDQFDLTAKSPSRAAPAVPLPKKRPAAAVAPPPAIAPPAIAPPPRIPQPPPITQPPRMTQPPPIIPTVMPEIPRGGFGRDFWLSAFTPKRAIVFLCGILTLFLLYAATTWVGVQIGTVVQIWNAARQRTLAGDKPAGAAPDPKPPAKADKPPDGPIGDSSQPNDESVTPQNPPISSAPSSSKAARKDRTDKGASSEWEQHRLPSWSVDPGTNVLRTTRWGAEQPDRKPGAALWTWNDAWRNWDGCLELHDRGPFVLEPPPVNRKVRGIRAHAGVRPMVVFSSPAANADAPRDSLSSLRLTKTPLLLEGLDLIFPLGEGGTANTDVTANESGNDAPAVWTVSGCDLLIKNCTITALGSNALQRTLFRLAPGKNQPTRVVLENCLIRTRAASCFSVTDPTAELTLTRCLVRNDAGSIIDWNVKTFRTHETDPLDLRISHSLCLSRGPFLEVEPPVNRALHVFALANEFVLWKGSTQESGSSAVGWFQIPPGTAPYDALHGQGKGNEFSGWDGWMRFGNRWGPFLEKPIAIADPSESMKIWAGGNPGAILPAKRIPADVSDRALRSLVAKPDSPWSQVPELSAWSEELASQGHAGGLADVPRETPAPILNENTKLTFNADDPTWNGDLGKFLIQKHWATAAVEVPDTEVPDTEVPDNAKPASKTPTDATDAPSVQVVVSGNGLKEMTPIQLKPGLHCLIQAAKNAGPGLEFRSRGPVGTTAPLFRCQGGRFTLDGLRLLRGTDFSPAPLLEAHQSHVTILNGVFFCRQSKPNAPLIRLTDTVRPRSPNADEDENPNEDDAERVNPSVVSERRKHPERLVWSFRNCIFSAVGDACVLEPWRTKIHWQNSAIAGTEHALRLVIAPRDPAQFSADLDLEHCTVTAQRALFRVESPAAVRSAEIAFRPLAIRTQYCAFMDAYARPPQSRLLWIRPGSLEAGWVQWTSRGDLYNIPHFLSAEKSPLPALDAGAPDDFSQRWLAIWGSARILNSIAPKSPAQFPLRGFLGGPLPLGEVPPQALRKFRPLPAGSDPAASRTGAAFRD